MLKWAESRESVVAVLSDRVPSGLDYFLVVVICVSRLGAKLDRDTKQIPGYFLVLLQKCILCKLHSRILFRKAYAII